MKALRIVTAVIALIMVAMTWQASRLPGWIAVPAVAALVIWGLNLDWRRKKRLADVKAANSERDKRRADEPVNRSSTEF
ncbi:hypothetical protein ACI5KX_09060 [Erythrobacter sp. GH1-10]|uniref:hypothetical protein n=1 Tax=Erythrobacter sp. GH1-10 TaxID=3349334 RepID=UPI0038780DE7